MLSFWASAVSETFVRQGPLISEQLRSSPNSKALLNGSQIRYFISVGAASTETLGLVTLSSVYLSCEQQFNVFPLKTDERG